MNLFVSLEYGRGCTFIGNGDNYMPDEEIRKMAEQYKKKVAADIRDKNLALQQHEILKAKGPHAWAALRQLIKDKVDEFNAEMGSEAIVWATHVASRLAMVRELDGAKLEGEFDAIQDKVSLRSLQLKLDATYSMSVNGSEIEFTQPDVRTQINLPHTKEEIATELLRYFTR